MLIIIIFYNWHTIVNTNTFSISRATDKNTLRFSYGKTIGDHVIKRMEEINRDNIALRMSQNITDKLTANVSFIYTHQKVNNRMYQNGSNRNPANNYMYMYGLV